MHICEPGDKQFPHQAYGPAITYCEEEGDGTLWATNVEYASQVNFCPFCGYRAKVQIPYSGGCQ